MFEFYYREKEIEISKQYTYLRFTFTPSGKKQLGIHNLINKTKDYINQKKKQQMFIQNLLNP